MPLTKPKKTSGSKETAQLFKTGKARKHHDAFALATPTIIASHSLLDTTNPPSSISAIGSVPWQLHSLSRCSPDFRLNTWDNFWTERPTPPKKDIIDVES